jgi:hypothetical protein
VLPGVVLMAIPIHSNFLLFVAAEAFFCIRLHVGPQLSCCSGMVGWFFTADPACRAAITAFARRSPSGWTPGAVPIIAVERRSTS